MLQYPRHHCFPFQLFYVQTFFEKCRASIELLKEEKNLEMVKIYDSRWCAICYRPEKQRQPELCFHASVRENVLYMVFFHAYQFSTWIMEKFFHPLMSFETVQNLGLVTKKHLTGRGWIQWRREKLGCFFLIFHVKSNKNSFRVKIKNGILQMFGRNRTIVARNGENVR